MNHCSHCGESVDKTVPPGDDRERFVCTSCGTIHYANPRMVVGCIPLWEDRLLLCRRAIEPRRGTWTIPAGFLENGESVEEGARRELAEEALASAGKLRPYGLYNIRHVSQVYFIFIADLVSPEFGAGSESLDARLVEKAAIPWHDLAFPVIEMTLARFVEDARRRRFPFHIDDVTRRMKGANSD